MALKLIVHGASGRMGREVINALAAAPRLTLGAAVVRPGSPFVGQDAGLMAGTGALGVPVTGDPDAALAAGDVAVDFSTPEAAVSFARRAAQARRPLVVGTTGLSSEQFAAIREGARDAPVLVAANLSVGVNVLLQLLPVMTRALGADYDIEIVEAHHRHKRDAPSGTALKLGEAIAEALGRPLEEIERDGRRGLAPRQPGEIGVHAIRAGGIVGEHSVLFVSEGEQVEISHRAFSRRTFALGALRAAEFLAPQPPGLYTMQDVLGTTPGAGTAR